MSGLCQGPDGKEIYFTVGLRKLSSNVGFEQSCNVRREEAKTSRLNLCLNIAKRAGGIGDTV